MDWIVVNDVLRKNSVDRRIFSNPVKVSLSLLKSTESVDILFKHGIVKEFSSKIADLCLPKPSNKEEKEKKNIIINGLPKVLNVIADNRFDIDIKSENLSPSYQGLIHIFENLHTKFQDSFREMERQAVIKSNPFITVSIKESYDEGKKFQISAKVASSIETKWGNWIQKVIPYFNNQIFVIGAAGYDYILGNVAYDIKSGPNVMNKDQVEVAKLKREIIKDLNKEPNFAPLLKVNDFKVAISYGKMSIAEMFMRDTTGLIVFGVDAWRELTGDEFNLVRLFLWQLRYQITELKSIWDKTSLNTCLEQFLNNFYDDDIDTKLHDVYHMNEYKDLEKIISK